MTQSPWVWSHVSLSLLVAVLIVSLRARQATQPRKTKWVPLIAVAIGMLLSVAPLGEVDLAGQLVAYSGELSFATLFYLAVYLLSRQSGSGIQIENREWNGPRLVWALSGLALYVSALGGHNLDVYSLGFGMSALWVALALSAILAITARWLGAVLLLGIVWAWQLRLSGGANFWDYAIDPYLFLGSLAQVLAAIPARLTSLRGTQRGCERTLSVSPENDVSAVASQ